ncbi:hypothetical protein D5086_016890 [Populus alba]|uniref:Uncharacterized protein n=2 Tax=Populus alba TaxID=43335 RepID=A0ACC4BY14_POPAL|nr:hypothetical protein D5086_0000265540 [Populus alba]
MQAAKEGVLPGGDPWSGNMVLEGMLEEVRGFHEQPTEVKEEHYSREMKRKVKDITMEYSNEACRLAATLFELQSEAPGLKPDNLRGMDCAKGHALLSHYYPACP